MWTGEEVCVCLCGWMCVCVLRIIHFKRMMLNIIACQKSFFILSERVVSCADHYHVSVHATVTGLHLYEMCMDFIRSNAIVFLCACVCGIQWLARRYQWRNTACVFP